MLQHEFLMTANCLWPAEPLRKVRREVLSAVADISGARGLLAMSHS